MTDYLEQPEEQKNALLEQAKRLEQALSALALREETETDMEGAFDWFEGRENSEENPDWEKQSLDEGLLAAAGEREPSLSQPPAKGESAASSADAAAAAGPGLGRAGRSSWDRDRGARPPFGKASGRLEPGGTWGGQAAF